MLGQVRSGYVELSQVRSG